MLFMSKHRRAPISEALRPLLMRARRSRRRRSRSTRSSQSTPIRPNVFNPMTNLQNNCSNRFSRSNSSNRWNGSVSANGWNDWNVWNCWNSICSSLVAQPLRHRCYRFRRRHSLVLKHRRKWYGHVHCAHAFHRRIEIIEGTVGDDRRNLCGDAVALIAFVDDNRPAGLLYGFDDRLFVEGHCGSYIDDFGADTARLQRICRRQRDMNHAARCDESNVATGALHVGNTKRDRVFLSRYWTL